jgi:hypothetical protein
MSGWRVLSATEVELARLVLESAEHGTLETAPHSEALAAALESECTSRVAPDEWLGLHNGAEWRVRLVRGGES